MKRLSLILIPLLLAAAIGWQVFSQVHQQERSVVPVNDAVQEVSNLSEEKTLPSEKTEQGEVSEEKNDEDDLNTEREKVTQEDWRADTTVAKEGKLYDVPFTSQAPFGEWGREEFQDGCEEASSLMAHAWVHGTTLTPETTKQSILAIAEFEKQKIGHSVDTSAKDTAELLLQDYFHFSYIEVVENFSESDLVAALARGIVLVPMNGRLLGNPNFTPPGPLHHMVVVVGYDPKTREFITNDPGTRKGKGYRYDQDVFFHAVRDYPTGMHEEPAEVRKTMIVVGR